MFSVGGAIIIAATVLRLPDQFGNSCSVAQLCAQNFTGRSLGSQLLLPFCAGVVENEALTEFSGNVCVHLACLNL